MVQVGSGSDIAAMAQYGLQPGATAEEAASAMVQQGLVELDSGGSVASQSAQSSARVPSQRSQQDNVVPPRRRQQAQCAPPSHTATNAF